MAIIDFKALTTCEVAADGRSISIGFVDGDGNAGAIRLSVNQVGTLAMTIPALLEKALRARFGDASLRYAYPLASWTVEHSSDPATRMITMRTVDGFNVSYSMPPAEQDELGKALADGAEPGVPPLMN
jgi:hypothetical protein